MTLDELKSNNKVKPFAIVMSNNEDEAQYESKCEKALNKVDFVLVLINIICILLIFFISFVKLMICYDSSVSEMSCNDYIVSLFE
jgi:hypothetical protein